MIDAEYIQSLSDYLFWDTDKGSIDLESNAPFVVKRVLEFGQMKDWELIVKGYQTCRRHSTRLFSPLPYATHTSYSRNLLRKNHKIAFLRSRKI